MNIKKYFMIKKYLEEYVNLIFKIENEKDVLNKEFYIFQKQELIKNINRLL